MSPRAPKKPAKRPSPADELRIPLQARYPLLWVVTKEERRADRAISSAALKEGYNPFTWSVASGARDRAGEKVELGEMGDPLEGIPERKGREVWVLHDYPELWESDPIKVRALKDLCMHLAGERDEQNLKTIVITSHATKIPPVLENSVQIYDFPLPLREELAETVFKRAQAGGHRLKEGATQEQAIDAVLGLTQQGAAWALAGSLVKVGRIDPTDLAKAKREMVRKAGLVEWLEPVEGGLEAVGGLEVAKAWALRRASHFTQEARDFGIRAPRGMLLLGVSGCGKTLLGRAVSVAWGGLPLLRLDIGAQRSKWVGESGSNIRQALALAEAVSPCILLMDEVEKALGGSGGPDAHSVDSDILGAVLTWLQDREGSVFVVMTANNVAMLPPELTRVGRLDVRFFVDLPGPRQRREVLSVALKARGRDPKDFALQLLSGCVAGYSGAEIEGVVGEALSLAFDAGEELADAHILRAAQHVVPVSRSSKDQVEALRAWSKTRALPASDPDPEELVNQTEDASLDHISPMVAVEA